MIRYTNFTIEYLKEQDFNNKIVNGIDLLTIKDNQNYLDYILLVKSDKIARRVKVEDLKHILPGLQSACLRSKYNLAIYVLTH